MPRDNRHLQSTPLSDEGTGSTAPAYKAPAKPVRIEPLEDRVMFSADIIGLPLAEWAADTTIDDASDTIFWREEPAANIELIFIDTSVPEKQILIDNLHQQIDNGRNAKVIFIQAEDKGLETITQTLNDYDLVSAIHIVSHGTDIGIQIGDTWLTNDVALENVALLNQWTNSLTENADLLIYGCNLAASAEGLQLIETLAKETQQDVAASIDTTGHDNLQANWTLEHTTGPIESDINLSESAKQAWENELATSLLAVDDNVGPVAYNTSVILGDANAIGDEDVTSNDVIDVGDINLINVLNPANGSIAQNTDNTFTFTPDNNFAGTASTDYIISDGTKDILHHWRLDDNAGGIVEDETGRINGTVVGSTVVPDNPPYLVFPQDTVTDYVGMSQPIVYPDSFTLSFQFRLDIEGQSDEQQFIDQGWPSGGTAGTISVWYENQSLYTALKGTADNTVSTSIVNANSLFDAGNDNNWHAYTLSVDTTTATTTIYIDGTVVQTLSAGNGGFNAGEVMVLGNTYLAGFFGTVGLNDHHMRDLRIYEGLKTPTAPNNYLHEPVLYSKSTVDLTVLSAPSDATLVEDIPFAALPAITLTHDQVATTPTRATIQVENGTLNIPGAAAQLSGTGTDRLVVSGNADDVEAALTSLTYQPAPNYHGTDTLIVNVDTSKISDVADTTWQQVSNTQTPQLTRTLIEDPIRGEVQELKNGDYLVDTPAIGSAQELTFSSWVNLENVGTRGAELFSIGDSAGLRLDFSNAGTNYGLSGFFHNGPTNTWVETSSIDNPDTVLKGKGWKHVAYVITDGHQGLYVDGIELVTTSYSTNDADSGPQLIDYTSGSLVKIGAHSNASYTNYAFDGLIDDAAIHARALSLDEIQAMAASSPYAGDTTTTLLTITPVNDAPVLSNLTVNSTTLTITESPIPQRIPLEIDIEISDIESDSFGTYGSSSLTLQRSYASADGEPGIATGPNPDDLFTSNLPRLNDFSENTVILDSTSQAIGIVDQNSNGTLRILFDDNAVKAEIDSIMQSITYSNISQWPSTDIDLQWTFSDGGKDNYGMLDTASAESDTMTTNVHITSVNQPPVITTNKLLTLENGSTEIVDALILEATDQDNLPEDLQYQLTGNPVGSLYVGNTRLDVNTGVIFFTQKDIDDGILRYESNTGTLHTQDNFSFNVMDGQNGATSDTVNIQLVEDFPHNLANDTTPAVYVENTAPVVMHDSLYSNTATDTNNNYSGMVLSLHRHDIINDTPTLNPEDVFSNTGMLSALTEGSGFSYNGNTLGIVASNSAGELKLEFNQPTTKAELFGVIESITYESTSEWLNSQNDGSAETLDFLWTVSSVNTAAQKSHTSSVDVIPVNDSPTGTDNTISTEEDTPYTFSSADFGFSDANADQFSDVRINSLPTNGFLQLAGTPLNADETIAESLISSLQFTPVADTHDELDYASFEFEVVDDGGTLNGGVDSDTAPKRITIQVIPVNDAPAGSDNTISIIEDGPYTFNISDFALTDTDNDSLKAIIINALPASGILELAGNAVAAGQSVAVTDIPYLVYQPGANQNGIAAASFMFSVQDDGPIGGSNANIDQTPNTVTFDIIPVNDAPAGTNGNIIILEDGYHTFSPLEFGFTDSESHVFAAVIIETLPVNGLLTLNGSPVFAGQSVNSADISNLIFAPSENDNGNGYASINFRVGDGGGSTNGGQDTDPTENILLFNITPVNDEPYGTDNIVSIIEDGAHQFDINDFGFNDLDGNSLQSIVITTLPSNGQLTLSGITVATNQVIPASTISDLIFTPEPNANGTDYDKFGFKVQDDGLVSNGGNDTDLTENWIHIRVDSTNDAPTGIDKNVTIREDGSYIFSAPDFGFSDIDNNSLLAVIIDTLPTSGLLTLNGTDLSVGQSVSTADISNLIFTPPENHNGAGYASIDFRLQDDGGNTNGGQDTDPVANTLIFDIRPVNDEPYGADNIVTIIEDTSHQFDISDFGFNDIDGDSLLSVVITSVPSNGQLALSGAVVATDQTIPASSISNLIFTPEPNANGIGYDKFGFKVQDDGLVVNGGIDTDSTENFIHIRVDSVNDSPTGIDRTFTINEDGSHAFSHLDFGFTDIDNNNLLAIIVDTLPAMGLLTLNDTVVAAGQSVNAADISNLLFTPPANENGTAYAAISFRVQDDGGTTNTSVDKDPVANTLTFDINPVNDEPYGADKTITIVEDTSHQFDNTDFGFNDIDGNSLQAIVITSLPSNGELALAGVAVVADQIIPVSSVSALVFRPETNANRSGYDQFGFLVQDDGLESNGGSDTDSSPNFININVASANDAPAGTNNNLTILEDDVYKFTAASFGFTDNDGNSLLAVIIDTLPTNGLLTLNGTVVSAGQSVSVVEIGDLVFTPIANASGVSYATIDFRVKDSGGIANSGQDTDPIANALTFSVEQVNDEPSGTDKIVTLEEDTSHQFNISDFGFTDPDGNSLLAITITNLPSNGQLSLAGVPVASDQTILTSTIPGLVFTPETNAFRNGYDQFGFTVQDNGGVLNGGNDKDLTTNFINISIESVNDAPTGSNGSLSINEDSSHAFAAADFGFNDTDNNSLLQVIIDTLPTNGQLALNGTSVLAGQSVNAADLGTLVFTPAANENGTGYATIDFRVQDDGGTPNNGQDTSITKNTITIDVLEVSDAPDAGDSVIQTLEDTDYVFQLSDFNFTDVADNNTIAAVIITELPTDGSLTISNSPVSSGSEISSDQISNGDLIFRPALHSYGSPHSHINFLVRDDGGTLNGGADTSASPNTLTMNVDPVNDQPQGQDKVLSINEDTPHTFLITDFGYSDSNDLYTDIDSIIPADEFAGVHIHAVPDAGFLYVDATPVAVGDYIDYIQIENGLLSYAPAANESGTVTVSFAVQDNGGTIDGGTNIDDAPDTLTINITSINDAPTSTDKLIVLAEDSSQTLELSDFGFNDSDDNNAFAAVTIVNTVVSGNLTLADVPVTSGTKISVADISNGYLVYKPPADAFGVAIDEVGFTVQDDGGVANNGQDTSLTASTLTFSVNSVSDEPSGADYTATTPEDSTYTFTRNDFGFADSDNNDFAALTVLTLPSEGSLTLKGNAVAEDDTVFIADIDSGQLSYAPKGNSNGINAARFDFVVQDDGSTAYGGINTDQTPNTWSIDITAVNDEPSGSDTLITLPEDKIRTIDLSDFGFSDIIDQNQFDAVLINTAPINGLLSLSGIPVVDSQIIATAAINDEQLTYSPSQNQSGNDFDQITFQVIDNGGIENNGAATDQTPNIISINVLPVNDAPSAFDKNIVISEDSLVELTPQDFIFSDVENDSLQSIRIDILPTAGTLLLDGSGFAATTEISADDLAQGKLFFMPNSNFNGTTEILFTVSDQGGTENQGINQDQTPNALMITVTPVNDAPESTNGTAITADNQNYTLSREDFTFIDTENHNFISVRIDTLPSSGILSLAGQAINKGDVIDIIDLDQGQLVFTPENEGRIKQSSFDYTVVDSGDTESGGQNIATQPSSLTFAIQSINDAPIANTERLELSEGESTTQTSTGAVSLLANDTDLDGDPLTAELIKSAEHGQFELFADGTFRYTHDGSETTVDEISYVATDGTASAESTVIIDIAPVNDTPVSGEVENVIATVAGAFSVALPENLFTDPDAEDSLQVTATLADGNPLPAWMSFDADTMSFSGTPPQAETLNLVLTATDEDGQLAQTDFKVIVEPELAPAIEEPMAAPVIEAPQEIPINEQPAKDTVVENPPAEIEDTSFEAIADNAPDLPTAVSDDNSLEIADFSNQAVIFRDFDLLARSIETHRTFNVKTLTGNEAVIDIQENRSLADLFLTEDRQSLNNDNLLKKMNQQREELQHAINLNTTVISGAVSVSTGLSLGYVIWLVRGGLLLGSVMSALPAWRNIDPLPILSTLDGDSGSGDDESLEDLVDRDRDIPKSEQGPDEGQGN